MQQGSIPKIIRDAIWNDKIYGWYDDFSRMPWVVAAMENDSYGGGSKML